MKPVWASPLEETEKRLAGIISSGDGMIVAVSGGIDSMVLLDVLSKLGWQLGLTLRVAHLDHQLRLDSSSDNDFVADAARRCGLPFDSSRRDVAAHSRRARLSIEASGRELRYRFLNEVAVRHQAVWVALGHHANDQAETVLLRLLRGSGITGLRAMQAQREGRYLRPLLHWNKSEIEAYARCGQIEFRVDRSNADQRFLRNRVRLELIPLLQRRFNPAVVEVLTRTANIVGAEDNFLVELTHGAVAAVVKQRSKDKIILDSLALLAYHIAIQRRVVRELLHRFLVHQEMGDFARVERVLSLTRLACSGVLAIADIFAQNANGELIFRRGCCPKVAINLALLGTVELPSHNCRVVCRQLSVAEFVELRPTLGGERVVFDVAVLSQKLQLRSCRVGDRFRPFGMVGRKKVTDFLVDCKWPRILRDEILVLTVDNEIAWVAGLRAANVFVVREDSTAIVLFELHRDVLR